MKRQIFRFGLCLSLGISMLSQAQDTLQVQELVITGTKTARDLTEVPGRISLVGSEIFDISPTQQVDDVLRFIPGVNVRRATGIYSQRPSVTLRGLSGDEQARTLVLMNGVPINTSDEGGVNWNRINPNDIERIEVFKGPGSSLYGNSAMGGVINIITKKASAPQEVFASVSYGTLNTVRQDLNIRTRSDKGFYSSVSQYYLHSDGYDNVVPNSRTGYEIKRSLEELGLSAKVGNDKSNWFNWELQYDVFRDRRGEGTQIHVPDGGYRNFHTNFFRGRLNGADDKTSYDINLYYQREHYRDVNERMRKGNYSRFDVDAMRDDMGALIYLSHQFNPQTALLGGFEYKLGSIDGGDYYQTPRVVNDTLQVYDSVENAGKMQTLAGYIQLEHALWDNKVRFIAGLRYDQVKFFDGEYYSTDPWHTIPDLRDNTWSEVSPRAGFRLNFIRELSAYVSYSHGFRASILDDLTRTGWMWVGPKYANPDLGPESLDNFEFGFDAFPLNNVKISASFYQAFGNDFLYYVESGDSIFRRPIYIRENVTSIDLKGAELSLQYRPLQDLSVMFGYTYSDSKIDAFDERPELEGKSLKYTPEHSFSVALLWNNPVVDMGFFGLYKGEQFTDDENNNALDSYFTLDMHVSKQIKNYILAFEIQDVFDNEHMETDQYLSPGRLVNVKAAIKF